MTSLIFKYSKFVLVGIVLLRLIFVFDFLIVTPTDSFSIEITEGESDTTERAMEEEADEFFATNPFDWQSSFSYPLAHYTHLIEGAFAHVNEIVTPPPKA